MKTFCSGCVRSTFILCGTVSALLLLAAGGTAKAAGEVTMISPTTGATITLPMMQLTYTIRFTIQQGYNFTNAKLLKDNGNGTFELISVQDAFTAVYDDDHAFLYFEAELDTNYQSGTGFKFTVDVHKQVPDPESPGGFMIIAGSGEAANVTINRN